MTINFYIKHNLNTPLPTITVGRASAIMVQIENLQADIENVQLHIGAVNDFSTTAAGANLTPGNIWKCYINGAYFPNEGKSKYHITGRNSRGDSVYLGWGVLKVLPSVLNVEQGSVPTIPNDTYLRGTDGKYYPLTIDFDEDGIPTPTIGEGVIK